jgi:hypothetical protein
MATCLPRLSESQLETLLSALDPQLAGFGGADCWLADARTYIARLGAETAPSEPLQPLQTWLDAWEKAVGNRETLRLALQALQAQGSAELEHEI